MAYKGFETGIKYAATPKLSVYLNAAFYRNRFDDYVIEGEDEDIVLNGNRLPISPDYVVNWGASWNPARSINATLNVKHVSSVVTTGVQLIRAPIRTRSSMRQSPGVAARCASPFQGTIFSTASTTGMGERDGLIPGVRVRCW